MKEKQGKLNAKKAKITRTSVVDQVCAAIKQDIADGVWEEGDKIPSEGEFADFFGVNRLSVRMALQKLNTLGIIETRVGEGSFVRRFSLRPVFSEIAVFYDDEEKYHEVQQLRNLLEGECMKLAAADATDQEKEELRDLLNRYGQAAKEYHGNVEDEELLERVVDADLAFHYQVVKMSHNALYKDVYFMVQQLIRRHISHMISTRIRRRVEAGLSSETASDIHVQIYEGIIHGDMNAIDQAQKEMLGIVPVRDLDVFE